jgi:hypothetical protein
MTRGLRGAPAVVSRDNQAGRRKSTRQAWRNPVPDSELSELNPLSTATFATPGGNQMFFAMWLTAPLILKSSQTTCPVSRYYGQVDLESVRLARFSI